MTRRVVLAVAAASLILGAIAFAGGAAIFNPQGKSDAGERGGGSYITRVIDRDGTRILAIRDTGPTNGTQAFVISAGQEVLVRQVTVMNGDFVGGVAEEGGITLTFVGAGGGGDLFFPFKEYGLDVYPMDPPLLVRQGDIVYFTYRNVAPPTGVVQLTLQGTPPQNATGIVAH